MNCPATIAEREHDRTNQRNAIIEKQTARDQLAQVEALAKSFLSGHTLTDARTQWVFEGNTRVLKQLDVTFGMADIAGLVSDELRDKPEIFTRLLQGDPSAIFEIQKLIGDSAHEVAFDALNLELDPFVDYEVLKASAENL